MGLDRKGAGSTWILTKHLLHISFLSLSFSVMLFFFSFFTPHSVVACLHSVTVSSACITVQLILRLPRWRWRARFAEDDRLLRQGYEYHQIEPVILSSY
jgi:membrane protein YdbS with pleckstrin-like domain